MKELSRTTPLADGYVRRPQLGYNVKPREDGQVEIVGVTKGRSADKAGIRVGDMLVAISGHPIKARIDLADSLANTRIGDFATLTVLRDGAKLDLPVEVGFVDTAEPLLAIRRILYEEKKVGLAVIGGEIINVKLTEPVALEQWAKGVKSNLIAKWENRFLKYFVNEKGFSIVDRHAVEQVMKELNFGQSGMVTEQFRAKLGKTPGATRLMTVEFSRFGDSDTEKQRRIEIETGKALARSTQRPTQ